MTRVLLIASLALASTLHGAAAIQRVNNAPLFAAPRTIDVGGSSGDIAVADLNRDGRLDLVTTRFAQTIAAVYFGDGRGSFAAAEPVNVPTGAGAITLADVTGDRQPDLIVASRSDGRERVSVMAGDGTGRFAAARSSNVTGLAFAFYKPVLRVADVNEDRRPDIISANGRRNSLEVLLGDGTGTFTVAPGVTLEPGDFHTFDIADVDGDSHLDVVSSSHGGSNRVGVHRGNGKGAFGSRIVLPPTRPNARVVALADVNGDTRKDIVLAHAEASVLSVFVNSGSGSFTPAAGSPYTLPAEAFEVAVADLNDDRKPDLVLTAVDSRHRPYHGTVVVLQGDSRGFVPAPGSPIAVGNGSYNLATGDVNADGKLDVLTSSFEGDPITLLLAR